MFSIPKLNKKIIYKCRCRATVPQPVHRRQAMDHRKWKTTWLTHSLPGNLFVDSNSLSGHNQKLCKGAWIQYYMNDDCRKIVHYYSLLVLHWITDSVGQDISKASEHPNHTGTGNPRTTATEILKLNSHRQNYLHWNTRNIYIHFHQMKGLSSKKTQTHAKLNIHWRLIIKIKP